MARPLTSNVCVYFLSYDQAYARGFEDMQRRVPDITKIQHAVGFLPELTLDHILDDVIALTRPRLGNYVDALS